MTLAAATVGMGRLRPAAPTIERSTLWTDTVKRGAMLRQARGNGTLVPEQIRWVSAVTAGRIERVLVPTGSKVEENTVLLELSNPDVQLEALDAQRQLALAQAETASLESSLQNSVLSQEGAVMSTRTEYMDALRAEQAAEKLTAQGLISDYERARAHDKLDEMNTRWDSEQRRLEVLKRTADVQLALQRAQVDRLRAIARFHQGRVASMQVCAGARGVLQEMVLEDGQWVNPGQLLAKVARPERLKAVLHIPETQAKDVAIGQGVLVDTHNGTVPGRVSRVEPAVQEGSVAVDVTLTGPLPQGARPDLSVDGTIEIERIPNTLYVGRPAEGESGATVGLFRLVGGGHDAMRSSVTLGRVSVNAVEVVRGLSAGDEVILSDMSRWDNVDRVHIR